MNLKDISCYFPLSQTSVEPSYSVNPVPGWANSLFDERDFVKRQMKSIPDPFRIANNLEQGM